MPDLQPSPQVVSLSDETLKKLAKLIETAMFNALEQSHSSGVDIDSISFSARSEIQQAVVDAITETRDE
jgi:hypothetical protein